VFRYFDSYKAKSRILLYSSVLASVFQVLRVTLFFVGAIMLGESPECVLSMLVFVSGIIGILPGGLIYVAQKEQFGSAVKESSEQH